MNLLDINANQWRHLLGDENFDYLIDCCGPFWGQFT